MGLNLKGNLVVENQAKQKITKDQVTSNTQLTQKEIEFVLSKLRLANYTGSEFELFYIVFTKLTNLIPKK